MPRAAAAAPIPHHGGVKRALTALLAVLALPACAQPAEQAVPQAAAPVPPTTPAPAPQAATTAPAPSGPAVSAGRARQGEVAPAVAPGGVALDGVYAYVNRQVNDCAQAAVATALTTTGAWARPGVDRQAELMAAAPPDVVGGVWGSSPRLVQRMLGAHTTVTGLDGVRSALEAGSPVLVLLDLGPLGRGRGAHWTVVVGLDDAHVQVTNLGGGLVERGAFERAWNGLVPRVAGMRALGFVPA